MLHIFQYREMNMMVGYEHDTMTAAIEFTRRHTAEITTYYAAVITINITSEITISTYVYHCSNFRSRTSTGHSQVGMVMVCVSKRCSSK